LEFGYCFGEHFFDRIGRRCIIGWIQARNIEKRVSFLFTHFQRILIG